MTKQVRIWEIAGNDNMIEIKKTRLDLEERLEKWFVKDISMIADNFLVIGRQVRTDFGGIIDLLCLDNEGNTIIIELKKDKTPREITAQALDYASWVNDLSNERINEIADNYYKSNDSLAVNFEKRFAIELPETLNEQHKILIVGSEIDESSQRIIRYLSDSYGVAINAITFDYFRDDTGRELLSRVFLIEPGQVEYKSQTMKSSKRRSKLTFDELLTIANNNGVGELYTRLVDRIKDRFELIKSTRSSIGFLGQIGNSKNTIFSLIPEGSSSINGLKFQVYISRFADYFGLDEEISICILPKNKKEWKYYKDAPPEWSGYEGYFGDIEEIETFLNGFQRVAKK